MQSERPRAVWPIALVLTPRVPLPAEIDLQCQNPVFDADVRQQAAAAINQQPSHKTPSFIPTQAGGGSPSGPEG